MLKEAVTKNGNKPANDVYFGLYNAQSIYASADEAWIVMPRSNFIIKKGETVTLDIRCVNGVRRFDRLNQQVKREVVYSFTTSDGVVHQLSPENTNRYKEFVEQTVKSQAVLEQAMQTHEPSEEVKAKAL